jgi:hypothetical protein
LSVIVIVPVCVPVAVGVNVTLMVHCPPIATEAPQVSVCEYCALGAMLVMVSAAFPELVSVTGCDALDVPTVWLLNVRPVGDKPTAGAVGGMPVPVRFTTCGLPGALSVIVIVPFCVPVAVGVNVTVITQFAPAVTEPLQVSVSEYCALGTMLVMLRVVLPMLFSVTACVALGVLTV